MNPDCLVIVFLHWNFAFAWNYGQHGADWTCTGENQSPIDIKRETTVLFEGEDMLDFSFDYCQSIPGFFTNNGKILEFETQNGNPSSVDFITGGPLGSTKYYFQEFHLHWGSPSSYGAEHLIDGQRMAGELQLVHINENYISEGIVNPNAYENQDGLAIVAIFLQDGSDYFEEWFDVIGEAINELIDSGMNTTTLVTPGLNLNQFVQRINPSYQADFNYWTYDGSLTTPDCNEAVKWIIAERPLFITNEQFAELSLLTESDGLTFLSDNYRKVQEENCRKISYIHKNTDTEYVFKPCSDGEYTLGRDCVSCNCNVEGSNSICNAEGQCTCHTGYTGMICNECTEGFYQVESQCLTCNCNTTNTIEGNASCIDGQCDCATGYGSQTCDCELGFYLLNGQCTECNCNVNGVFYENWTVLSQFNEIHLPCEDTTGNCIGQCHPGYTGSKCDTCAENYEIGYDLSEFFNTEFVTCRKSCPDGYDVPNQGLFLDFPYNITNLDYFDDSQTNQTHDQHYNSYPHLCFLASSDSLNFEAAKTSCALKSNGILFQPETEDSLEAVVSQTEIQQEYWYDNGSENTCTTVLFSTDDDVITTNTDCLEARKYLCQTLSIVDQL